MPEPVAAPQPTCTRPAVDGSSQPSRGEVPTIEAARILHGGNEAFILHAGQKYRLFVTRANKLLLTK